MKKSNPIYLWYSVILLFPPVHELGHVIIANLCGYGISAGYWNHVVYTGHIRYGFIQNWWQYSPLISLVCALWFLYIAQRDRVIILNRSLISSKKVRNEVQ